MKKFTREELIVLNHNRTPLYGFPFMIKSVEKKDLVIENFEEFGVDVQLKIIECIRESGAEFIIR